MSYDDFMNKDMSRKKFLGLLGAGMIGLPILSKSVLGSVFFRGNDGNSLKLLTQTDADTAYLKLDQTTPQNVTNGAPSFNGGANLGLFGALPVFTVDNLGLAFTSYGTGLMHSGDLWIDDNPSFVYFGNNGAGLSRWQVGWNNSNFIINAVATAGEINLIPTTTVNVTGNLTATGNIYNKADNSKHYFGAGDDASITYDGTNLLINPREVGSGNVGIGTVSPKVLLDVGGVSSTLGGNLAIRSDSNHVGLLLEENSGGEAWGIGVIANGSLQFFDSASNAPKVTFQDETGNVGIGATAPSAPLHIRGATNGLYFGTLAVQDTTAQAAGVGGRISFGGKYTDAGDYVSSWATLAGLKESGTTGNYGGYLEFATRPNGGTMTERMRITSAGDIKIPADSKKLYFGAGDDASITYDGTNLLINPQEVGSGATIFSAGKVGIGTTSPSYKLHLADSTTETSGVAFGTSFSKSVTSAVDSSALIAAITGTVSSSGAGNFTNSVRGLNFYAGHYGTGTLADLRGVSTFTDGGYGNITEATGIWTQNTLTGNAITSTYNGIKVMSAWRASGTGTVGNAHGIRIYSQGSYATNAYGLYLENQTGASTNNYSIYSAGGTMYHAGNVGIGVIPTEKLQVNGNLFLNADNNKLYLGAGKDASITYDGTNLLINPQEVGSGATIFSAGNVVIGSSGSTAKQFTLYGSTNILVREMDDNTYGPTFIGQKKRSSAPVSNGDVLFQLSGYGWDGTTYKQGGVIAIEATETFSGSSSAGKVTFGTTPTGSIGPVTRMTINSAGNVGIGVIPTEKLQVTGNLRLTSDNNEIKLGAAADASIKFTGTSLDIQSDVVTATDELNLRGGTNGIDFLIGATEQMTLTDGVLAPTTDDDVDLGIGGSKEFKDIHAKTVRAKHYAADDTAPVADGTYAVYNDGVTSGQVTSLTLKDGIITAIGQVP